MRYRKLGKSGLFVYPIALGKFGWTADGPTAFAIMDAFVEAGGNLIDTADIYSTWAPGNTHFGSIVHFESLNDTTEMLFYSIRSA